MYNDFSRAIHVDFHTMSGIYDINDFDAEKFAELLADAKVTYVNVFAECNLGFCYFPTKVGIVYPGLKKDILGELVSSLHKRKIGVTAYINSGLNNAILEKRPEWCRRDKDGQMYDPKIVDGKTVYRRYSGCFNTGYGEYLKSLVKEILDNYEVDGIFMDCVPMEHCYCENCSREMKEANIDINDEPSVYQFAEDVRIKFARELKKIVGNHNLFFNSWYTWDKDLTSHYELECLPNGTWTYEYFAPHAAYARTLDKKTLYMTGRFQNEWGDFGGICSKASLEHDMYDALMSGFGYSVGDHAHPSKTLIPKLYKTIKEIYSDLIIYHKYAKDAVYKAEIGIYSSPRIVRQYDMWKYKYLCHMLDDLKYSYNVTRKLSDLSKYRMIILPENTLLNEEEGKVFEEYIKKGGKVLSCGKGGLKEDETDFAISYFRDAVDYHGVDERSYSFFEFTGKANTELSEVQWNTYGPSIMMKAKYGKVLADDVKAYFDKEFDGERFNLYIPPEKKTEYTTAVVNDNIAHVSFNVFESYGKFFSAAHRELVRCILENLIPNSLIKAEGLPISSRANLTETDKHLLLNVKSTFPGIKGSFVDPPKGVITEHVYLPAGIKVLVNGKYKKAINVYTGKAVKTKIKGEYTEVTLPEIKGFVMISFKKD